MTEVQKRHEAHDGYNVRTYFLAFMMPGKVEAFRQKVRAHLSKVFGTRFIDSPPAHVTVKAPMSLTYEKMTEVSHRLTDLARSGSIRAETARFCGVGNFECPQTLYLQVEGDGFLHLWRRLLEEFSACGIPRYDQEGKAAQMVLATHLSYPRWKFQTAYEDTVKLYGAEMLFPERVGELVLFRKRDDPDSPWVERRRFHLAGCGG